MSSAVGQEESVLIQIKELKQILKDIKENNKAYSQASQTKKVQIVKEIQKGVNKADKDIKNLEFEVSMLPISQRENIREKFLKIRTKYNECRKVYFKLEDDLNTEVLQMQKVGSSGTGPQDFKKLRGR